MRFTICAIILAFAVVQTVSQSNNYEWGLKSPEDEEQFLEIVNKPPVEDTVREQDIDIDIFPAKISWIQAIDEYEDGTGGTVELIKGGLGETKATLHLQSQKGLGYRFTIEVWGQVPES